MPSYFGRSNGHILRRPCPVKPVRPTCTVIQFDYKIGIQCMPNWSKGVVCVRRSIMERARQHQEHDFTTVVQDHNTRITTISVARPKQYHASHKAKLQTHHINIPSFNFIAHL